MFKNQEFPYLVIISLILMTLMYDSVVILSEELDASHFNVSKDYTFHLQKYSEAEFSLRVQYSFKQTDKLPGSVVLVMNGVINTFCVFFFFFFRLSQNLMAITS